MKKLVVLFCLILFASCVRRTPESLLMNQFQIDLTDFNYSVKSFDDEWMIADGRCRIVFSFDSITTDNISYLIGKGAVPLSENSKKPSYRIPQKYLSEDKNGYYLYKEEDGTPENFSYFILDLDNNEAVLYYQII